jgi:hypothetical protein
MPLSDPPPPPPPKLTPEILKHHGITYIEAVIDSHELNHINTMREGLLDFDCFLNREITRNALLDTCYNYNEISESAFRNTGKLDKLDQEILLEFISMAKDISFNTQKLQSGLCQEALWQYLFKDTIFKPRKDPRLSKASAEKIS